MISYLTTVKLHEVDSADRMFFANQFKIAHDAWEAFLESIGIPLYVIHSARDYALPIAHAEGDYKKSVSTGDKLKINVTVAHIGNTSFTMSYEFSGPDGAITGIVKCVHVAINSSSGRKIPVPAPLKAQLLRHTD